MSLFWARFRFCQARGTDAMQAHGPQGTRRSRKRRIEHGFEYPAFGAESGSAFRARRHDGAHNGTCGNVLGSSRPTPRRKRSKERGSCRSAPMTAKRAAPVSNFQSLVTFAQGGTLTNITTGDQSCAAHDRPRHLGKDGRSRVHGRDAWSSCSAPPAPGRRHRESRIRLEIGTNPDELTGTTEVNFFDTGTSKSHL